MTHYIDQVRSPNPVSVRDWTGSRIPLHAVSSGEVLVALAPPVFVQRYLGRPMEPFTVRTLVTAADLLERMRAIRRDGYTWALEEFDEGISSVAAPVADASGEVVAAVHLHGPSYRFPAVGDEDHWRRWSSRRRCGSRGVSPGAGETAGGRGRGHFRLPDAATDPPRCSRSGVSSAHRPTSTTPIAIRRPTGRSHP